VSLGYRFIDVSVADKSRIRCSSNISHLGEAMSCVSLLLLLCFVKTLGAPLSADRGAMVSVWINLAIAQRAQYIFICYNKLSNIMPIFLSLPEAIKYCLFMRQVAYYVID
jgi:hypothetical protein